MTKSLSKLIISVIALMAAFSTASAQTDYSTLEKKAVRFFDNAEWRSAHAMYLLMLDQRPHRVDTYAHAVVADIMAGDTLQALNFTTRAMSHEIPIDSLLADVRTVSFSLGHGDLYENYLLKIKDSFPWFSRVADNYLMRYYSFRQNGPELVKYARTMLVGMPDNRGFLRMLAKGLLLEGRTDEALATWLKVASLYPDDYDTLLDLANCYDTLPGEGRNALEWFEKANALRSTPYVRQRIAALRVGSTRQ